MPIHNLRLLSTLPPRFFLSKGRKERHLFNVQGRPIAINKMRPSPMPRFEPGFSQNRRLLIQWCKPTSQSKWLSKVVLFDFKIQWCKPTSQSRWLTKAIFFKVHMFWEIGIITRELGGVVWWFCLYSTEERASEDGLLPREFWTRKVWFWFYKQERERNCVGTEKGRVGFVI